MTGRFANGFAPVAPLLVENWLIRTIKAAIWTSTKTWKAAKLPGFNVAG